MKHFFKNYLTNFFFFIKKTFKIVSLTIISNNFFFLKEKPLYRLYKKITLLTITHLIYFIAYWTWTVFENTELSTESSTMIQIPFIIFHLRMLCIKIVYIHTYFFLYVWKMDTISELEGYKKKKMEIKRKKWKDF